MSAASAGAIPIVFRDDELIVVDKPVGISIHNTEDAANLIEVLGRQMGADASGSSAVKKLFPIHRLDKETSGIQIFARNEVSAAKFATEFQSREVLKIYFGILRGTLRKENGIWSQPLTDKAEGRANPAGLAKDRINCETRFQIRRRSKFFTEVEFDLRTGRQHQIRKHAVLNGHALVGDTRYGDGKYNRRMAEIYAESRMFLHCGRIEILGRSFACSLPEVFDRLLQ